MRAEVEADVWHRWRQTNPGSRTRGFVLMAGAEPPKDRVGGGRGLPGCAWEECVCVCVCVCVCGGGGGGGCLHHPFFCVQVSQTRSQGTVKPMVKID